MNERELQDLEEPANWDYENAEKRPGVKRPRAVVSVSLTREEFELVAKYAQHIGMRTSEFIRKAALDRATHQSGLAPRSFLTGGGVGSAIWLPNMVMPPTRVSGAEWLKIKEPELAATT